MEKTLYQQMKELKEAVDNFILQFAYSLKIDKMCEFITNILNKIKKN